MHRETAGRGDEEAQAIQSAGAGKQLEEDGDPGEGLVRDRIEAVRQILHDGGDAAAPPSLRKDEVPEQKTGRIAHVESGVRASRSLRHARGARESPGAEPGHEAT